MIVNLSSRGLCASASNTFSEAWKPRLRWEKIEVKKAGAPRKVSPLIRLTNELDLLYGLGQRLVPLPRRIGRSCPRPRVRSPSSGI